MAGVLRDCVLLKPGSTVEDVFAVLKRPPYLLLEGDFVRAEARVLKAPPASLAAEEESFIQAEQVKQQQEHLGVVQVSAGYQRARAVAAAVQQAAEASGGEGGGLPSHHPFRVVKKDEPVGPDNCVLLIQTNRKAAWQATAGVGGGGCR
jgi:hypothetical protein